MSCKRFLLPLSLAMVVSVTQPDLGMAQLTVQQPVFGVTNVATTVSVPDRGRAHLGSISRARDSRTHFGPFRPGTNTGLDREHTGMSVGVYIHDFAAMDEYLLSQGSNSSANPQLSRNVGHAWSQLHAGSGASTNAVAATVPQTISKSEKYWQLGQKAEREGKVSVAQLHYRIAAKYGSEAAENRMAELASPRRTAEVATTAR